MAELQQNLRKDGNADPNSQLRATVRGQHHARHPQQTLQRPQAGVPQSLQPTPLPHPVEGGTLVAGTADFLGAAYHRCCACVNRDGVTWLQCSVTCANGTQQRKALCHTRDNTIGLCLDSKPDTIRVCRLDPCPSEWTQMSVLPRLQPSSEDLLLGCASISCSGSCVFLCEWNLCF